jgi:hypothetical protein
MDLKGAMVLSKEEYEQLMEKEDRLAQIFRMQKELMYRIGVPVPQFIYGPDGQVDEGQLQVLYYWIQKMGECIIHEGVELRDWTPWKHWSRQLGNKVPIRQGSAEHIKEIRTEVIDLVHFVVELAVLVGLEPDDLVQAYVEKNEINHQRQEKGDY